MKEATKNTFKELIPIVSVFGLLLFITVLTDNNLFNEIAEQPVYYCAIIWILFSCLSAKFEAHFYSYASKDNSNKPNLHTLFTIIRLDVVIPIWILTDWKAILCYIGCFLSSMMEVIILKGNVS